jgi:hypothetical protein
MRAAWPIACAAAVACATGPALAQTLGQGQGVEIPWWRVVGALVFCLGLALAAAVLLKRRLGGGPALFSPAARRVKLVETLRLSHQIDLCVIHYDDQELLVAAGANGAALLSTKPKPEAPSEGL